MKTEMTDRYEKIRKALAMGPTPGPWLHDGDGVTADDEDVAVAMCCPSDAEAAYIAACDPDTIRALLDERDALVAENARLRKLMLDERDALAAEVERLEKMLRELEEREQRDEDLLRQALEAAQIGLRYAVRVWVLSDEIEWSEAEIDKAVESIISDAKKEAGND